MRLRFLHAAPFAAAALASIAFVACTNDFDQFEPVISFGQGGGSATGSGGAGGAMGTGGSASSSSSSTSAASSTSSSTSASSTTSSSVSSSSGGPMPVCGDGNLDPGEECDDGNTIPADRCSATCTTENPDTCPGPAVPLAAGKFVIQDDTSGATNDTGQLPCGGSASGDFVYAVTPMQNGTLTATLDGQFGTKLYARADCPGMNGNNLACSPSQTPAIITLPVTAGQTIWLFVDGYGGNAQEGPFTLTLDLQ